MVRNTVIQLYPTTYQGVPLHHEYQKGSDKSSLTLFIIVTFQKKNRKHIYVSWKFGFSSKKPSIVRLSKQPSNQFQVFMNGFDLSASCWGILPSSTNICAYFMAESSCSHTQSTSISHLLIKSFEKDI